jgi:hypothetical protein
MRLLQRFGLLTVAFMSITFGAGQHWLGATTAAFANGPVHGIADASTLAPPALDLAAMVIRPQDLIGGGWVQAESRMTEAAGQPGTAGTDRTYLNVLKLTEPADWNRPRQAIGTTISEYADGIAATEHFGLAVGDLDRAGFQEIAGDRAIGEASITLRGTCDCGSNPIPTLALLFQQGRLVARIDLVDLAANDSPATGSYPLTAAALGGLGEIVSDHTAAISTGDLGGGLGTVVARIGDERNRLEPVSDDYLRLAGVDLPQYLKDRAAAGHVADGFADATDVYWYGGRLGDDSLQYSAYLYRFPSEDAASAWLDGAPAALRSFAADAAVQTDAPVYGDQSVTYRYSYFDGRWQFVRTYLRVGAVVASIDVGIKTAPTLAAVDALVSAQTRCLQTGLCAATLPIPDEL